MDEDYEITLILTPDDEEDFYLEVIDKALELISTGRVQEAVFYLQCASGVEYDSEH